ncbi:MAG TPA: hypothetical protein VMU29_14930 [Smithella sp.]|nr:hypothetical protein [Smithella sp.]
MESFDTKEITLRALDMIDKIKFVTDAKDYLGPDDPEVKALNALIGNEQITADHHLFNYQIAVILVRAINQKREPNRDDENECRYTIRVSGKGHLYTSEVNWCISSDRLVVFSRSHAEYLLKQFPNVFRNFMLIKK